MAFILNDINLQTSLTFMQAVVEYTHAVELCELWIFFIWPWPSSEDLIRDLLKYDLDTVYILSL